MRVSSACRGVLGNQKRAHVKGAYNERDEYADVMKNFGKKRRPTQWAASGDAWKGRWRTDTAPPSPYFEQRHYHQEVDSFAQNSDLTPMLSRDHFPHPACVFADIAGRGHYGRGVRFKDKDVATFLRAIKTRIRLLRAPAEPEAQQYELVKAEEIRQACGASAQGHAFGPKARTALLGCYTAACRWAEAGRVFAEICAKDASRADDPAFVPLHAQAEHLHGLIKQGQYPAAVALYSRTTGALRGESAFIRCRAASFLGEMLLVELSTTISSQFRAADEGEGPRPLGVSSLHALYNHLQAVVLSVERASAGVLPASPLALILYVQATSEYRGSVKNGAAAGGPPQLEAWLLARLPHVENSSKFWSEFWKRLPGGPAFAFGVLQAVRDPTPGIPRYEYAASEDEYRQETGSRPGGMPRNESESAASTAESPGHEYAASEDESRQETSSRPSEGEGAAADDDDFLHDPKDTLGPSQNTPSHWQAARAGSVQWHRSSPFVAILASCAETGDVATAAKVADALPERAAERVLAHTFTSCLDHPTRNRLMVSLLLGKAVGERGVVLSPETVEALLKIAGLAAKSPDGAAGA
ncbi:hypothetical protein DIPPA_17065 [Diplonema papillatum]|nr:hypothetical protein DIPPA_17065 [Diplonema papillatum]|eukprot:gene16148-24742_t